MFLERIGCLARGQEQANSERVDERRHAATISQPHAQKAIDCARLLLGSSLDRRKGKSSLIGSWISVSSLSQDCDSEISDTEEDNDETKESLLRDTRWSSNPSLSNALFLKASFKSLSSTVTSDTPLTLPTRKRSLSDLKSLTISSI